MNWILTFYIHVNNDGKAALYAAIAHEFCGLEHWYYRENSPEYTIGDHVMPMGAFQCLNVVSRLIMIVELLVASVFLGRVLKFFLLFLFPLWKGTTSIGRIWEMEFIVVLEAQEKAKD